MSDEHRPSEVADWGSGDDRPTRALRDRTQCPLLLITAGVFLVATCSAVTAWTVVEMRKDEQVINCYLRLGLGFGGPEEGRHYDDMSDSQRAVVDRLDCDVPGR